MKNTTLLLLALLTIAGCNDSTQYSSTFEILDPPVEDPQALAEFYRSPNSFVRAAMHMRLDVEEKNTEDLDLLLSVLRETIPSQQDRELDSASAFLANDKGRFAALKLALDQGQSPEERGSSALRTSLDKLTGKNGITGILDDAALLLADKGALLAQGTLGTFKPRHNEITVTKSSLIYLLAARLGIEETQIILQSLHLLYPAMLPDQQDTSNSGLAESPLFSNAAGPVIHVPNAGYIFGGEFQGAEHNVVQGIDCSAFLSHITGSTARLSTMLLEYAWRIAHADDFSLDDPDGSIREDLRANWGLDSVLDEYDMLASDTPREIGPGTLVVWRSPKGGIHRSGHVVMALEATDLNTGKFHSIEAGRTDNKAIEGIIVRQLDWVQDDTDTFILRKKTSR